MNKVYGIYEGGNLIPIECVLRYSIRNERMTFISQLKNIGIIENEK